MEKTLAAALFVLMLVNSVNTLAAKPSQEISAAEARALVLQLLRDTKDDKLPGFSLKNEEPSASFSKSYYDFEADWAGKPAGDIVIGFFLVDKLTGDIWNGVICEAFHSPTLTELQNVFREKHGLTKNEYKRLRKAGPYC